MDFYPDLPEEQPSMRYSAGFQNWYNYRTNILHVTPASDPNVYGRSLNHEWSHFALHCSTPYGLVMDDLNHLQTTCVVGFCQRADLDLEGQRIPRPLYRFIRRYGLDLEFLDNHFPDLGVITSLAHWFVRPWSLGFLLENVLEGIGGKESMNLSDRDAVEALEAYESYFLDGFETWPIKSEPFTNDILFGDVSSRTSKVSSERGASIAPAEIPVGPKWNSHDSQLLFGGFHIFEGVAQLIEGNHSGNFQSLITHSSGLAYIRLWALMLEEYAQKITSREQYESVMATFFAICELALFVPLGPVYGRLRRDYVYWVDVQPGYRAVRAIQELKTFGLLSGFRDDLDNYQETVCRHFGWPTPKSFLRIGVGLKGGTLRQSYARHRDACELRLAEPWTFVRLLADSDAFEGFYKRYPPMMSRDGEIFGWNVESIVQQFASTVAWNVMMRAGRLRSTEIVPKYAMSKTANSNDALVDNLFQTFRCFRDEHFMTIETP
jgi:hypothetical protein